MFIVIGPRPCVAQRIGLGELVSVSIKRESGCIPERIRFRNDIAVGVILI